MTTPFHAQHSHRRDQLSPRSPKVHPNLCNEGGSGGRVVFEGWGNLLLRLVVSGETVDTGLDQDETELGILILAVDLEVLTNRDSLFDEVPEILGDLGSKTAGLQDTEDLVTSDKTHLWDTMRVTESNTDLGGGKTFAGQFGDVLNDIIRGGLEP